MQTSDHNDRMALLVASVTGPNTRILIQAATTNRQALRLHYEA